MVQPNESLTKIKPIIEYIVSHVRNDERPYLKVSIMGQNFLGLLDSGATHTFVDEKTWLEIRRLGFGSQKSEINNCLVGNGMSIECIGEVLVPVKLENRESIVKMLIVPELAHGLILGINFWKQMDVLPDLRGGSWTFAKNGDASVMIANAGCDQSLSRLTYNQQSRLDVVTKSFFEYTKDELGCTSWIKHEILTDSPPIKQKYYRVSPYVQHHIDAEVSKMLEMDVIEESVSPWSSPILLVKKKDDSYRFVVDFRELNKVSKPCAYPVPFISGILDKLSNAKYLSTLDVKSAYWQIPLEEKSRELTAFTVPGRGLFQFKRMPFGLHSGGSTWQRLIDMVVTADLEPHAFAYLDDIVIVTETFDRHLEILEKLFDRLKAAGLTLSREKCNFCRNELKFLGYVIDSRGIRADGEKIKAILEIPVPKNVKQIRSVVGTVSWYRRFIPNFTELTGPLNRLTRKNVPFSWDNECDIAFMKIKDALVTAPILSCPDFNLPFTIQCDASGYGIAAVLSQIHPDGERVVCYLSRSLNRLEKNYSVTERECLAVLWAIEKFRPYIEGIKFTVVTDHSSLLWLNRLKTPNGRLARWAVRIQQFQFDIVHRKGKDNIVPDTLSRAVPELMTVDIQGNVVDKWYIALRNKIVDKPLKYPEYDIRGERIFKRVGSVKFIEQDEFEGWRMIVPREERKRVFEENHDLPTAGHGGVRKTFQRIRAQYYWPKMRADIAKYVSGCHACQMHKPSNKRPVGLLLKHAEIRKPWQVIAIDFVGPLPRSKRGNKWILTVTDCFTKFVRLFPLKNAHANNVVRILEDEIFLLFGVPQIIICDNAKNFTGSLMKNLCTSYEVKLKFTPYYHPQADPAERVNRNVKTMIACYVKEDHQKWDESLAKISCALRTGVHESIKHTPYFLNFGREQILRGSRYTDMTNTDESPDENGERRAKILDQVFQDVSRRMDSAFEKNKSRYDLRKRDETYFVGSTVWRRNYAISDATRYYSAKLAPRFVGPFVIAKRVSPWTYELKDDRGKFCGTWHAKDLRILAQDSTDEN